MAERLLGKAELEDIVWGATLLGSGGGGLPSNGLEVIKKMKNKVTLVDPADCPDSANAVIVAGMQAVGLEAFIFVYEAMKNITAVM